MIAFLVFFVTVFAQIFFTNRLNAFKHYLFRLSFYHIHDYAIQTSSFFEAFSQKILGFAMNLLFYCGPPHETRHRQKDSQKSHKHRNSGEHNGNEVCI